MPPLARSLLLPVLLPVLLVVLAAPALTDELARTLAFELEHAGDVPRGWGGGPPGTLFVDGEVVHEGEWAARLERGPQSPGRFTSLTRSLPIDFAGQTVELRGHLRTEDVTTQAGLWLRQDADGRAVAFDNMASTGLVGTTEWTAYRIVLQLDETADTLFFGALLAGTGKVWADELELLVDGRPLAEAPKRERPQTVFDTDTAFDAGSKIDAVPLDGHRARSLALLGKVWGFLKYHHPRIAAGELHWDYELFRVLPAVLAAEDAAGARRAMLEWIRRVGVPDSCDPCAEGEAPAGQELHLPAPAAWIHDAASLGEPLSAALVTVHQHRFAGREGFYIGHNPQVGNPDFRHEKAYANLGHPDAGYRLLALFRFWNIIEYWFPYRDVIGEPWHAVLEEMLPIFAGADEDEAYRLALLRLAARVKDTHVNFWQLSAARPPVGDCALPVILRFVGDRPVVRAVKEASEHGLRRGDVLTELDGRPVAELLEAWAPYYAASNRPTRLLYIARSMTRGACGPGTFQVERDGRQLSVEASRVPLEGLDLRELLRRDRPGPAFVLLSEDVAYLRISGADPAAVPEQVERALGTKGWILDLRGYPKGFVVFALGQRLVAEKTAFARFTAGAVSHPGAFTWGPPLSLTPVRPRYSGKIVILVDETSLSSSEYHAMAFQAAPDAVVVGSTTAGADGNVSRFSMPGGHFTMISGIGVFYPDKTPTQRVGIVPDIVVTPTVEGLRDGKDEVLEAAKRLIQGPDEVP